MRFTVTILCTLVSLALVVAVTAVLVIGGDTVTALWLYAAALIPIWIASAVAYMKPRR